jgi:hypothetical protein
MDKGMIPALRKAHRRTWVLGAVLFPVLFILAYAALPGKATQAELFIQDSVQIGTIDDCRECDRVEYCLREDEGHRRQIELIIHFPLIHPSNRLEVKGFNFGEIYVDAAIGSQGVYRWSWTDSVEASYQVRLLDKIKKEELCKLELKRSKDHPTEHHH